MIDTNQTKQAQLAQGFYKSGTGTEKILILGSCRVNSYLNYLVRFNATCNRFTIYHIDPNNWHWNAANETVDLQAVLLSLEESTPILSTLSTTDIFIHEHLANFGIFNTDRSAAKNVYQFGMNARLDITIPNFNDVIFMFNDLMQFDAKFRDETDDSKKIEYMRGKCEAALGKFYRICQQTSFPEFGDIFRNKWRSVRYFWTSNHVSRHFTLMLFELMSQKFLHLPLGSEFWREAAREDLFRVAATQVMRRDIEAFGLKWTE